MTNHEIRKIITATMAVAAVVTVIYACAAPLKPEDVRLKPSAMDAVSSAAISAAAGATLTNQPSVLVKDQYGDGLANVAVTFTATGTTQPTPATVTTNSSGIASPATWTMQTTTGSVTLTASGGGLQHQFTVTVTAGAPATATVANNSNNQTGVAGQALAAASLPQVKVADQFGNAVPGAAVTFAVTGGGGSVTPTTAVTTDAAGIAKPTTWTLGATVGTNTLRATAAGVSTPVTFTATGTAGPAASIVINPNTNSQNQSTIANTNVAVAPSVLVKDANGNIVTGVVVRFTVSTGGGKVFQNAADATGSTTFLDFTTDGSGIATAFAWKLGAVGANALSVTVPSVSSLAAFTINATGTVGPPTQITTSNLPWGFVRASTQVFGSPRVLVRDVGGNAVSGATVNWAAGVNGSISGTVTGTTNSSGLATFPGIWTAGATTGATATLIASVQGTSLTQSFSSLITGSAASIQVSAGNSQSAAVNTAVATKPAVLVKDAAGNPVTASNVTFAVTGGGGSITTPTPNTDSVGVATVGSWIMGTAAGASNNTLSATATSTAFTTNFTATATAGPAASITVNAPDDNQSASVNTTVSVNAVVKDQFGNPVSGASVTFTVTGTPSFAAVTSANPATTNTSGFANAVWRLDTLARTNTLNATTASLSAATFTATSTALAASKLAIVQGNNQTAAPSTTLPIAPQVRVTDQYNNTIFTSTSVFYATGASSGTITNSSSCSSPTTSCTVSSSAVNGIAPLNTWTLGTATSQTLTAKLNPAGAVLATFTASTSNPCVATAYTLASTINGALQSGDCVETTGGISNAYVDPFAITVPASTTRFFSLTVTPSGFTPQIKQQFYADTSKYFYVGGNAPPTASTMWYFLGPGTVRLGITSTASAATGTYQMTSVNNPTQPSGCGYFVSTRGISIATSTLSFDTGCDYAPAPASGVSASRPSKVFYIYAGASESITINMNSAVFAARLEAYDNSVAGAGSATPSDAAYVTSNAASAAGVTATITVSGGTTGKYFLIRATQVLGTTCNTSSCTFAFSINP